MSLLSLCRHLSIADALLESAEMLPRLRTYFSSGPRLLNSYRKEFKLT